MMSGAVVVARFGGRCINTTLHGLIAKIPAAPAILPHFVHIGATRLDAIGSATLQRLAAASVFAERKPDLELERA